MADTYEEAPVPEEPSLDLDDTQLERIRQEGQKLIEKDAMVQSTCVTLLYAQQLYHCGLAALRRYLEENKKGDRQVEAFLIKSMQSASMNPFSRQDLVKKTQAMVLPWLMAEIEAEQKREQAEQRQEEESYEEARRAEKFQLPWFVTSDEGGEGDMLSRDRSLVMVGHDKAVELLLQHVINTAKSRQVAGKRLVVCRLLAEDKPLQVVSKSERGKRDYFEIGRTQWENKLTSQKKTAEALNPWLRYSKRHRIDMLIVDDLRLASPKRNEAAPDGYHLNEVQKMLRKWCNAVGAFMVAGVPAGTSTETLEKGKDWDLLDVYSTLRMIQLLPGPTVAGEPTYHLTWDAGDRNIVVEPNVPRKLFDHE